MQGAFDFMAGREVVTGPEGQGAEFDADTRVALGQYFTPVYAMELLAAKFFPGLTNEVVVEPTCGDGGFLKVLPETVRAYGVELDPRHARSARKNTPFQIITGDFATTELPVEDGEVDCIMGNPPYEAAVIDQILARAKRLLHKDGEMGMILPSYIFQTPSRVMRYSEDWRLEPIMIPRTLFPRLSVPISFVMFRQSGPQWMGMALYQEAHDVSKMPKDIQAALTHGSGGIWQRAVHAALVRLGGRATLAQLYQVFGKDEARPSDNPWWKAKIRQVAGQHFDRVDRGVYQLPQAA